MRGQKVFFFFLSELSSCRFCDGEVKETRVIASDAPFYVARSYRDSVKLAT